MIESILVQIIGFLAAACFIISFQIKSNKILFLVQVAGNGLFCVQFFLLGAISGCFNLILAMVRNILLMRYDQWNWVRWKGWVAIFAAISVAIMIYTWQGPLSILPLIALVVSTMGYWTNNAQKIRLCNLACVSPTWLIYDIFIGSLGGIINELTVMTSIGISVYRYGWKNMNDPEFGKKRETEKQENPE